MMPTFDTSDPYLLDILRALEEQSLDEKRFEAVMADVLRPLYPNLVPVSGGWDYGQDGAGVDPTTGAAFTLVATTAQDDLRNLTRSMERAEQAGKPRKLVFVTSQSLSPRKRKNREDRAEEKGFELLQIIDRDGVANLLYHRPERLQELLGLSGRPWALSTVPRSRRPQLPVPLLGRDRDVEWLRETAGERGEGCVVAGEPGSGKTYLLSHLVEQEEGWYFLVDDDREAVANALRRFQPRVVVVDDAHVRPDVLELLRHRRDEAGQRFAIVAATWKGARDEVQQALGGLGKGQTRALELLTRDELLELYESLHLGASTEELRELIDQASNKPGLAVTLALLWRGGARREIWTGEALVENLRPLYQELLEDDPLPLLAAFALGGDRGMTTEAVAEAFGESTRTIFTQVTQLSAGGVLAERGEGHLSVWPRTLRSALIGRVFFGGAGARLGYRSLLERAPVRERAIRELVLARLRGASVSDQELWELVKSALTAEVWVPYVHIGRSEARVALEELPRLLAEREDPLEALGALGRLFLESEEDQEKARFEQDHREIVEVFTAVLVRAPDAAVRALMGEAAAWRRRTGDDGGPALENLSRWITTLAAPVEHRMERRRILATEALRLAENVDEGDEGSRRVVAFEAFGAAFQGLLGASSVDPGIGSTVQMTHGPVPVVEVRRLRALWSELAPRFARVAGQLQRDSWRALAPVLDSYVTPKSLDWQGSESPEWYRAVQRFAETVLRDLVPLAAAEPGIRHELARLARANGTELELEIEPTYELLTAPSREELDAKSEALVADWVDKPPEAVTAEVARYVRTAESTGDRSLLDTRLRELLWDVASRVDDSAEWLEALWSRGLGSLGDRFLVRVVEARRGEWRVTLARALEDSSLKFQAALVALQLPEDEVEGYFDRSLAVARETSWPVVQEACARGAGVAPRTLERLLEHEDHAVVMEALVGEWRCTPRRAVRRAVGDAWTRALLGLTPQAISQVVRGRQLDLADIWSRRPDLALGWLVRHGGGETVDFRASQAALDPIDALGHQERERLLAQLPPGWLAKEHLGRIVRRDKVLYRVLLDRDDLRDWHLGPLPGLPLDEVWREMAGLALDRGHDPEAVSEATIGRSHSWTGSGLEYWQRWENELARYGDDPDARIRAVVGGRGLEWARRRVEEARIEERHRALHGLAR